MGMLGIKQLHVTEIIMLVSVMSLLVGVLPNVAGMGPTEFAFMWIFVPILGRARASSTLLLYRLMNYFIPFLLSLVMV